MNGDGGPAFPDPAPNETGHPGMSLLDYYAGQAIPELLADQRRTAELYADIARAAYEMADAMLAEKARRSGR